VTSEPIVGPKVELNTEAVLTDEMIEGVQAEVREGVEHPVKRQWHAEASLDSIRHWAWGIGDDNPLWSEPDYGAASQYGTNLAPPSFLYSCNQGPNHFRSEPSRGEGLPGLHAVWAWERWTWHRPILRGTSINATKQLVEANVRASRFGGGRSVEMVTRYTFRDGARSHGADDVLAVYDVAFLHYGRNLAAVHGDKHGQIVRQVWRDEELARLRADLDTERRRGGDDLRWDDVKVGEAIPPVVKGPLSVTETIAFVTGWGGPFIMASEIAHRYVKDHPRANVPDRYMRIPEFPQRAHWDGDWARECGFPDAYDFGGQRIAWLTHAVTNWMGDNAHLAQLKGKLTGLNIVGDATWCTGSVRDKYMDDDSRRCIVLDLEGTNQRGQVTVAAEAVVVAPA
jgi:N-terminal half of MaoC dehydratase